MCNSVPPRRLLSVQIFHRMIPHDLPRAKGVLLGFKLNYPASFGFSSALVRHGSVGDASAGIFFEMILHLLPFGMKRYSLNENSGSHKIIGRFPRFSEGGFLRRHSEGGFLRREGGRIGIGISGMIFHEIVGISRRLRQRHRFETIERFHASLRRGASFALFSDYWTG